ncbi:MAG: pilus assembly protein CpaB [Shewanella psychromarinicola]|jgi:pilus assembly protein CpaB|uniref:Flp pilus assembly protein CpaB n=1 Tax=Shewanella psychromarinicola TaxID=2487742 RepID=UPI003EE88497
MAKSNKSNIKLIAIALVLGVVGALLAMFYLNAKEAQLREKYRPKSQPISVVVAARDLVKGDILNSSTLSIRPIPRAFVSNLAVLPADFDSVEGKVLQVNLAAGKPLLNSFTGTEFPLDFSDTIIEKRRAMTIQIDELNSFTGLLRPGNKIDLFVITAAESEAEELDGKKIVIPVLENVEVISTGRDTAYDYEEKVRLLRGGVGVNPQQSFSTITLNVTPKQAAVLTLAQETGDIMALLRNRRDLSGSGFAFIDERSILANALELLVEGEQREQNNQLAGSIVVGEDGLLRTRDGKVLANQNLVIGADGSIRTKSGIDLASRGLSINENGEIVTADGRVVDPDNLIVLADGTLMTRDGVILDGPNVRTLAGGLQVLEDGTILAADGTVITGATLDENGNLVLADGTVVNPNDVVINSDGTMSTRDGQLLAGLSAKTPPDGSPTMLADGSVRLADGTIISGATIDKDGNLVLADGSIVNPDDLVVNTDGSITTKDGRALAGLMVEPSTGFTGTVDFIVGGVSENSVLQVNKVPVAE